MGIRFKKRAKIAPGVNLNFTQSGTSVTVGGKGGSINIGKNGIYGNAGIPGTGIYTREKISGNDGENEPYIYSICAPIYNMNGKIRAAISLGGMKEMIYSDRREEYTEMVRKTAEDISAELGYLPRV